jgi:hypothetical protein
MNEPIEMTEWEWERFVPLTIRRGYKYIKVRRRFVEQGMKPHMAQFLFMSGCPNHVAREILDEIRTKGGDDMGGPENTATLTHKGRTVEMPNKLPEQKELDFATQYELVHFDKFEKATHNILRGLDQLGVSGETMTRIMNSIAIDVPEIVKHFEDRGSIESIREMIVRDHADDMIPVMGGAGGFGETFCGHIHEFGMTFKELAEHFGISMFDLADVTADHIRRL